MTSRRRFLAYTAFLPLFLGLKKAGIVSLYSQPEDHISDFCRKLKPVGRILETEGYYVWGTSPIKAPDGKIHVFYSRWPEEKKMGGWLNASEIAHAVADSAESEFKYVETVLAPSGEGFWDGTTCHNPHIKEVDGKYCLFYIGNANRKTDTKRIGLATADSLYGPWKRPDKPLLDVSQAAGAWDNHCTSNPSFVKHTNGQYWLYYKSWNSEEYYNYTDPKIRGNRKYGLAIAENIEGPYTRYSGNPVIDFSSRGKNTQFEDAYVWHDGKKFRLVSRDMGIFGHTYGLYMESDDGIYWSEPLIAYFNTDYYFKQPPAPPHLSKYGRFERPQLLLENGSPTHLFVTTQGGRFMTSSAFVFSLV
ncbi:MAG: glycoside hydrolase family protein [Bacteroidales bacterium]|nr:glycoside hydrolase family protein [Bacteroidales bacterium]